MLAIRGSNGTVVRLVFIQPTQQRCCYYSSSSNNNSSSNQSSTINNTKHSNNIYNNVNNNNNKCKYTLFSQQHHNDGSLLSTSYLFNTQNNTNSDTRFHFRTSSPTYQEKRDLYEVLGVSKNATQKEIKQAFYGLAKKFHPDSNQGDPNAHRRFSEISNAYDILSDENKRATYDTQGHQGATAENMEHGGFNPHGAANMEEMFQNFNLSDLFGEGFGGGGMGGGKMNGADIQIKLHLDFMEAVNGCNKDVTFHGSSTCNTCNGSGAKSGTKATTCKTCNGTGAQMRSNGLFTFQSTCKSCKGNGKIIKDPCGTCRGKGTTQGNRTLNIKIPQGVNHGMNIKLTGQGEPGERGGRRGNLYVNVSVSDHELFKREGNDIHLDVPITMAQAVLGANVTIPTLTGEVDLKVGAGTQPGEKRVLRNKGIRSINDSNYGNQYVHFIVSIPKSVNERQKQLINDFDQEEKNKSGAMDSIISMWNSAMKRWRDYSTKK